ncbi:hypothetical protein KAU33_04175 [Candidatus Dependentiae bacterium]|nr:hypothetical protein [Candidatus Dependentiae bacterium]
MTTIITEISIIRDCTILKHKCPVCDNHFKAGDKIEFVPIQKSKDGKKLAYVPKTVMVHTECHFVSGYRETFPTLDKIFDLIARIEIELPYGCEGVNCKECPLNRELGANKDLCNALRWLIKKQSE